MTGLALLQFATDVVWWLHLLIVVGFEIVNDVACGPLGAQIAWSGGTFDQALELLQRAAVCSPV